MPEITDAVAAGRAGHEANVLEVLGNLDDSFGAVAGAVFDTVCLVDDEGAELLPELDRHRSEVNGAVDVDHIDVGRCGKRSCATLRIAETDLEMGCELAQILRPRSVHDALGTEHEHRLAVYLVSFDIVEDLNKRLACATVAEVKN